MEIRMKFYNNRTFPFTIFVTSVCKHPMCAHCSRRAYIVTLFSGGTLTVVTRYTHKTYTSTEVYARQAVANPIRVLGAHKCTETVTGGVREKESKEIILCMYILYFYTIRVYKV